MSWTWLLTALSIIGTVLNIRKARVCFVIWTVTNTAWAIVDWRAGIPAQAALHVVYLGLAVWGVWEWRRQK